MNYDQTLPGVGSLISTFGSIVPNFGPSILWIIFSLVAVILGFTTLVLYYHWIRYAFGNKMVIFAAILYTLVTLGGLAVMISSIHYYVA